MTPEGHVKAAVKRYLDSIGAYYFMPVQTGYGKRTLDFLCCIGGRFVVIETKPPGSDLDKFQAVIKTEMEKAGALVIVAHSAAEVEAALAINGHYRVEPLSFWKSPRRHVL